MTDLALLAMFLMFISLGLLSPFVWSLGYVWVDTLSPHLLSYSLLAHIPAAFIMGAGAFASYLLMDRRSPPRLSLVHVLCGLLAVWITCTTTWAVRPTEAWFKWDASFKTLIFTCFMPFVFRTRIQIEAYLLVFLFAAAGHLLPWGFKTLLTGGGYEQSLGLMGVNAVMLSESSTVAMVTVMFVPLLVWFRNHSLLVPWHRVRTAVAGGLIVLYVIANVGTFARTGLIGLIILGFAMLMRTKRKILYLVMAGILGSAMLFVISDRWTARISTISNYEQESSANTRILIWKWTIGFSFEHPLGGGFNSYLVNVIPNPPGPDGEQTYQYGRAFHNIYMAALGEHGYPGLVMYFAVLSLSVLNMSRVIRRCKENLELLWIGDLARASQISLIIIMVCGNFIDASFSFLIWDIVALTICLSAHLQRVVSDKRTPAMHEIVAGASFQSARNSAPARIQSISRV